MNATAAAQVPAWRDLPVLAGRHATLEPLTAGHAGGLRDALAGGGLDGLWFTSVPDVGSVDAYLDAALAARSAGLALPFAVRDAAGAVVGCTRCYRLQPEVPTLCIGYTWYARRAQRTGVNTTCKQLLLGHAFETLGCISVTFETSSHNHASRAALARLGARQDGVLRKCSRHPDGSPRDSVVFSIIDTEWPEVKRHLQARLEAKP